MAIYSLHGAELFHGDIKLSNILLTTNLHVFLSDFATYKPFYTFDEEQLGGLLKQKYNAPEKFYKSKEEWELNKS